ncbi:hypothetical protein ACFE04_021644 [Oxalis oulophora]
MGDENGTTPSPPPSTEESTSPPPSDSSPPPPTEESSTSPPPPNDASPPPSDTSPPPPTEEKNASPPPPSQTNPPSPTTGQTFSPPPPIKDNPSPKSSSDHPSPPQSRPLGPPWHEKSSPSSTKSSHSSEGGLSSQQAAIIGGVVAGVVAIIIILMVLICFACKCKGKKKKPPPPPMQYYNNNGNFATPSHKGYTPDYYKNDGGGAGYLPPPPGGPGQQQHLNHSPSWLPPMPPAFVSSEMSSSNFSGPAGTAPMPPLHPSAPLGHMQSSFSYNDLAAATNGFSQANLLGQGGFGYVHKGILPNGKEIAVKSLKSGSGQGEREFQAEVEIISRVHHRHLVSLVGYCIAGGQKMLVYEFVPNNNLDFHLHGKGRPIIDFLTRLKIALGSAKGLAYLHEDCHPRIIHRDIKTPNILIDYNFEAKVADFGLAKLTTDTNTHVSTRVMGTFGYLAPEYASSGKLTEKSDVFSFGVMLLELITGRRPVDPTGEMEDSLVDWARPLLSRALEEKNYDAIADPMLERNYNPEEMARLVSSAAASIRHSAKRRPKMSQIVRALEGDMNLADLNEGVKPGQSTIFSSSAGSSDYDASSYSTDMKKFRKLALDSQEINSSEYGATSEYGLNPSSSSSEASKSGRASPNLHH